MPAEVETEKDRDREQGIEGEGGAREEGSEGAPQAARSCTHVMYVHTGTQRKTCGGVNRAAAIQIYLSIMHIRMYSHACTHTHVHM